VSGTYMARGRFSFLKPASDLHLSWWAILGSKQLRPRVCCPRSPQQSRDRRLTALVFDRYDAATYARSLIASGGSCAVLFLRQERPGGVTASAVYRAITHRAQRVRGGRCAGQ
jgi:hypothetical protein